MLLRCPVRYTSGRAAWEYSNFRKEKQEWMININLLSHPSAVNITRHNVSSLTVRPPNSGRPLTCTKTPDPSFYMNYWNKVVPSNPTIIHSLENMRMLISWAISVAASTYLDATRRSSLCSSLQGELSKKKPLSTAASQLYHTSASHQENQIPWALLMSAFFFHLLIIMVEVSVRKPQAWWMANLIGHAVIKYFYFWLSN